MVFNKIMRCPPIICIFGCRTDCLSCLFSCTSWWLGRHYGDWILRQWPMNKEPELAEKGRGAFAKWPGTPSLAARGQQSTPLPGDLIELTDTNSDDGRGGTSTGGPEFPDLSVQNSPSYGPVRGARGRSPGGAKANKAD